MTAPTTKPPSCMDDAFGLSMEISGKLIDDFCARPGYRLGGHEFELEDSEEGEPFVLRRESDGARFEVELFAEVRQVSDGKAPAESEVAGLTSRLAAGLEDLGPYDAITDGGEGK